MVTRTRTVREPTSENVPHLDIFLPLDRCIANEANILEIHIYPCSGNQRIALDGVRRESPGQRNAIRNPSNLHRETNEYALLALSPRPVHCSETMNKNRVPTDQRPLPPIACHSLHPRQRPTPAHRAENPENRVVTAQRMKHTSSKIEGHQASTIVNPNSASNTRNDVG